MNQKQKILFRKSKEVKSIAKTNLINSMKPITKNQIMKNSKNNRYKKKTIHILEAS